MLSPHFALSEILFSPTAVRDHIANDPDPAVNDEQHLARLCNDLLEPVRNEFDALHVNSGLRRPLLNAHIAGSASVSAHMFGWAADVVPIRNGVTLKAIVDWVIASNLRYDQVIYEGTWVHLALFAPNGTAQRKQALMMFPDASGKPQYSPYLPNDPRVR